jgi:DNA-binding XRE family transcriptional regulator
MPKFTTKFSKVVQIKKDKIKQIENFIQKINYDIRVNRSEKEKSYQEIEALSQKKSGDFSLFRIDVAAKNAIYAHIKLLDNEHDVLEETLAHQRMVHKKAMLEYEKILYLENIEIAKIIKAMKHKEQVEMDEISNLLFNNPQNKDKRA